MGKRGDEKPGPLENRGPAGPGKRVGGWKFGPPNGVPGPRNWGANPRTEGPPISGMCCHGAWGPAKFMGGCRLWTCIGGAGIPACIGTGTGTGTGAAGIGTGAIGAAAGRCIGGGAAARTGR